jgi:hypothetical protein
MAAQRRDLVEGEGRRWMGLGREVRRMRLGSALLPAASREPQTLTTPVPTSAGDRGRAASASAEGTRGDQGRPRRWRVGVRCVGAGSGGRRGPVRERHLQGIR